MKFHCPPVSKTLSVHFFHRFSSSVRKWKLLIILSMQACHPWHRQNRLHTMWRNTSLDGLKKNFESDYTENTLRTKFSFSWKSIPYPSQHINKLIYKTVMIDQSQHFILFCHILECVLYGKQLHCFIDKKCMR